MGLEMGAARIRQCAPALVPGLSALAAVALLGEPLGWNLVAGLVLVTAGILFGVRSAAPQKIAEGAIPVRAGGQNRLESRAS